MCNSNRFKRCLLPTGFLLVTVFFTPLGLADPAPLDPSGIQSLSTETNGKSEVKINRSHGAARFVDIKPGQKGSLTSFKGATPKDTSDNFLVKHGKLFGISNSTTELSPGKSKKDNLGFTQVQYNQLYNGLSVIGGNLMANVNSNGDLRSVNGRFIPNINVSTTPTITSKQAMAIALDDVNAENRDDDKTVVNQVKNAKLVVYNPSVFEDRAGATSLAYQVQVSSLTTAKFVYVDAQKGYVIGKIDLRPEALYRRLYDSNQTDVNVTNVLDFPKNYPNKPYWVEGNLFPTTDPFPLPDASYRRSNDALAATQFLYNIYKNTFDIDAPDGLGSKMDIIMNYTPGNAFAATDAYPAMYTAFGLDISDDETVGHEWQHWYTNFAGGGLAYINQGAALHESYSDMFGESVDLLDIGTPFGGLDLPNNPRTDGQCSIYTKDSPNAREAFLDINSPPSIAAEITEVGVASFGQAIPLVGVSGDLVHVDDGVATGVSQPQFASIHDGCQVPFLTPVNGKIALIKRGECTFALKVENAQNQGALGVVIYNRDDEAVGMGGSSTIVTIPSLMIKSSLADSIISTMASNTVNVTLRAEQEPRYTDDSLRWLIGDDSGGNRPFGRGFREMWDPTCLGQPGKVTDPQYVCSPSDAGGGHTNMAIPSHAYALLVDGGTYNGQNIGGLGMTKTMHIYHRAQASYQTYSMNFADHADALEQACSDLIGQPLKTLGSTTISGQVINASDCNQVAKAMLAVEMRTPPVCLPNVGFITIAPVKMLEGNSGTKQMVFTVHLSAVSDLPVTMSYNATTLPQFNPATDADNGSDFLPAKGKITIPAGAQDGQFSVTIKGDTKREGDERFMVYIDNIINADPTPISTFGVILNDD